MEKKSDIELEGISTEKPKKKEKFINSIEMNILAFCFAIMCIITMVNVITRYFFSFTFSWAEQLTKILFVWFTFSGISYAGYKCAHLKVTALESFLPKRIGRIILLIGDIISVLFGFATSYYILTIVISIIQRGQTFPSMPWLSAWVMYIPGVIFMFTFALRVIQSGLIPGIKAIREGDEA